MGRFLSVELSTIFEILLEKIGISQVFLIFDIIDLKRLRRNAFHFKVSNLDCLTLKITCKPQVCRFFSCSFDAFDLKFWLQLVLMIFIDRNLIQNLLFVIHDHLINLVDSLKRWIYNTSQDFLHTNRSWFHLLALFDLESRIRIEASNSMLIDTVSLRAGRLLNPRWASISITILKAFCHYLLLIIIEVITMLAGLQARIYGHFARNIRRVGRDVPKREERTIPSLS